MKYNLNQFGNENCEDVILIKEILNGDKNKLSFLLQKNEEFIYNVSLKMRNNISDAEDATQEILIKIMTNLSSYDASKAKFTTWLLSYYFQSYPKCKKDRSGTIECEFQKFLSIYGECT